MSGIRRAPMASSPLSSDEATHHDTPSTIPTTFSPEQAVSNNSKAAGKTKAIVGVALPKLGCVSTTASGADDVFLTAPLPTPNSIKSELSPTAEVFRPGIALTPATSTPRPSAGNAAAGSVPRNFTAGVIGQGPAIELPEFSNLHIGSVTIQDLAHSQGVFSTDDNATRSFLINNVSPLTVGAFNSMVTTTNLQTFQHMEFGRLETEGSIVVTFSDLWEAKQAFAMCHNAGWSVFTLNPRQAAFYQGVVNADQVSAFEGQVIVTVFYDERNPPEARPAFFMLRHELEKFGAINALRSLPKTQRNVREFRMEYRDPVATMRLLHSEPIETDVFVVKADRYAPDVPEHSTEPFGAAGSQLAGLRAPIARPQLHLSATGRSTVPAGNPGYEALLQTLQQNTSGRRNAGHAFTRIDVQRITLGLDVRTTVMLRNIPNRVTSPMLKEIIDKTSLGYYDFMYLRIDFANNCNVGYAFINFVDPVAIVPFAEAHQGQRWNAFQSDKVAEISYATIQGRENLIEKFRNSSVMLEAPDFRPKLYLTGRATPSGQEEPFPGPNNLQKMKRSVENAEHVGLYRPGPHTPPNGPPPPYTAFRLQGYHDAPARAQVGTTFTPPPTPIRPRAQLVDVNAPDDPFAGRVTRSYPSLFAPRQGQAYREEQRRRRSQFDRGTPGAELEMADFRGPRPFGPGPRTPSPPEYRFSSFHGV